MKGEQRAGQQLQIRWAQGKSIDIEPSDREEKRAPLVTALLVLGHECHPAAGEEEHSHLLRSDHQCWGAERWLGRYGYPPPDNRAIRMHAS